MQVLKQNTQGKGKEAMNTIKWNKLPQIVKDVAFLASESINGKCYLVKYSVGKVKRKFWHERVSAKVEREIVKEITMETAQAIQNVHLPAIEKTIMVDPFDDMVNRRNLYPNMEQWLVNFFCRPNGYLTMTNAAMLNHFAKDIPNYNDRVMAVVANEVNEAKKQEIIYAIAMLTDEEWAAVGQKRLEIMQETASKIAELTKMGYKVTK